jgi:hypothetical protein
VGILFSRNSLTISLGVGVFVIDLGAKAPTTNLRDLGADTFVISLGAGMFIELAKKRLLQT